METPVQTAARLLGALEEMIGREEKYLQSRNYDLVVQLRERTDPLVRQLVGLSTEPGMSDFRSRVALLVGRSAKHSQILDEKMREVREQIKLADRARRQTTQLAPAYTQGSSPERPRFSAAG